VELRAKGVCWLMWPCSAPVTSKAWGWVQRLSFYHSRPGPCACMCVCVYVCMCVQHLKSP
jgi:hypothetical protein